MPPVKAIASKMTFSCATDGNHGRSVAQGAELVGAKAVIFVHAGVSDERVEAIARFGAETIRVDGDCDDSVAEAARVATENGWTIVSDTSWSGHEPIPGLDAGLSVQKNPGCCSQSAWPTEAMQCLRDKSAFIAQ